MLLSSSWCGRLRSDFISLRDEDVQALFTYFFSLFWLATAFCLLFTSVGIWSAAALTFNHG